MSTKGVEHVGVQYKTWRRLTQSAKDDNNDDDGGDGGDGECRPAGVTVLTDVALLKFMYYGWSIR